ncbi:MAG: ADP-glyceromanno-heptose 6-epimerase [Candidatus Acidiferrum sp.]
MPSHTNNWTLSPSSRILVTGGAGFIGSALIWALNTRGCREITVVDFPPNPQKQRNLHPLKFESLFDPAKLLSALASNSLGHFDFIFHLGACSSTTETNEEYLRKNNVEYTRDLAQYALAAGSRFIYASSAATYGDGSAGMDDLDPSQLPRFQPLNLYGHSKHQFDLFAWNNGWLDRIVGLKYFNVFGPNEAHKGDMRSVVHKSYAQVQETGVIRLFKSYRPEYRDGEQRRDFLYVKDAVAMTLHLAESSSAAGLYNIGSGSAHTWNELAHALFAAMEKTPLIEYVDMPTTLRDKYQYFTQASIQKLLATGYSNPVTPLSDAVRDSVLNYLTPNLSLGESSASLQL